MLNMKDKKRQCSMAAVGLAFILYNLSLVIFISVSRYYFLNRWLEFYHQSTSVWIDVFIAFLMCVLLFNLTGGWIIINLIRGWQEKVFYIQWLGVVLGLNWILSIVICAYHLVIFPWINLHLFGYLLAGGSIVHFIIVYMIGLFVERYSIVEDMLDMMAEDEIITSHDIQEMKVLKNFKHESVTKQKQEKILKSFPIKSNSGRVHSLRSIDSGAFQSEL